MKLVLHKAFFIIISCLLLLSCGEVERIEKIRYNQGYRGEAKRNPYLAAQKFLEKFDVGSEFGGLMYLDISEYGTVVLPASSIKTQSHIDSIKNFLDDAGHLILALDYAGRDHSDFNQHSPFNVVEKNQYYLTSLLNEYSISLTGLDSTTALKTKAKPESELVKKVKGKVDNMVSEILSDLTLTENDQDILRQLRENDQITYEVPFAETKKITIEDKAYTVRLGGKKVFDLNPIKSASTALPYEKTFTDNSLAGDGYNFLSKPVGISSDGRLTVLSDIRFIRNPHIAMYDHADFLVAMKDLSFFEKIYFSYGTLPGFLNLLFERFWIGLICLGLCIFFWVVTKLQRFGPVQDIEEKRFNNYLESIRGSGRFLFNKGYQQELIEALRLCSLKRFSPNSISDVNVIEIDDKNIVTIAEQINEEVGNVRKAFQDDELTQISDFIEATRILQKIKNHDE